jgi:hypothetical protein
LHAFVAALGDHTISQRFTKMRVGGGSVVWFPGKLWHQEVLAISSKLQRKKMTKPRFLP